MDASIAEAPLMLPRHSVEMVAHLFDALFERLACTTYLIVTRRKGASDVETGRSVRVATIYRALEIANLFDQDYNLQ